MMGISDINDLSDSSLFRALFPGNYARLDSSKRRYAEVRAQILNSRALLISQDLSLVDEFSWNKFHFKQKESEYLS